MVWLVVNKRHVSGFWFQFPVDVCSSSLEAEEMREGRVPSVWRTVILGWYSGSIRIKSECVCLMSQLNTQPNRFGVTSVSMDYRFQFTSRLQPQSRPSPRFTWLHSQNKHYDVTILQLRVWHEEHTLMGSKGEFQYNNGKR